MSARTSQIRSLPLVAVIAFALILGSFSQPAAADDDPLSRHQIIELEDGISPNFKPAVLRDERILVMLKLLGEPVAKVQARSPGRRLPKEQKDALKKQLEDEQDALDDDIANAGGRVAGKYQVALNGIKVEVPSRKAKDLAGLPGVTEVSRVELLEPDNDTSVPLLGTPAVWQNPGLHGEGIKIAIIDTGIDYTHANFGGPGTAAAFNAAKASSTAPADPALFGPGAPKVKGGIDLVGDSYDAASSDPANRVPKPDPNPLDCFGHGSHVAGTAAGFGVTSEGQTFTGSYGDTTFSSNAFRIGPGVAPKADLYAVRVFGCVGSTAVTVDAIEWAVDNDMDAINMSLGSAYGFPDTASAEAATNAAEAGVIVVASAGNSGAAPYITGSPAAGTGAISVAASEALTSFPGVTLAFSGGTVPSGTTITALNANDATFSDGTTLPVKVLTNPDGTVKLGCNHPSAPPGFNASNDYVDVAGKLVVTRRGTCARVARAIFGQKEGAAAVAMINSDSGFPPLEGPITSNPDTGEPFTVTIPFLGIRGCIPPFTCSGDTDNPEKLVAAGSATLSKTTIANPNFKGFASFTSGGPRTGDSALKPDITAPGVSTLSTAMGTGNHGTRASGTSMAAPHVAGVAALVRQAHPDWSVEDVKAAIVNTGSPPDVTNYRTSRGGTGLVQPIGAIKTRAVAIGDEGTATLSFGFAELSRNFTRSKEFEVKNHGTSSVTFNITSAGTAGSRPHTLSLNRSTITLGAGKEAEIRATLTVPAATVLDSSAFSEVAGLITLTPAGGGNNGVALRVPYYQVPRALSDVKTRLSGRLGTSNTSRTATVTNREGVLSSNADFYAWGLEDKDEDLGSHDLRAVGVQSFASPTATDPTRRLLVFAVNTWQRWSSASLNEIDVLIDTNGDGTDDFAVVGVDLGLLQGVGFNGTYVSVTINLATRAVVSPVFLATAPTDSSTVELPVRSTQLGLTSASRPRFSYTAASFPLRADAPDDFVLQRASFNAFTPSLSTGQFVPVAPGATASTTVTLNATEFAITPARGFLVVALDNASGKAEAQLISLRGDEEDDDDEDDDDEADEDDEDDEDDDREEDEDKDED